MLPTLRIRLFPLGRLRRGPPDKAILPAADEVRAARQLERLQHQRFILRNKILHQSPLHRLFLAGARDIDFLHCIWVQSGIEHAGGDCPRRGVEILHLFGVQVVLLDEKRQLHRVFQRAPRMRGHQVGNQILLLADLFGQLKKALLEGEVCFDVRLSHAVQPRAPYSAPARP